MSLPLDSHDELHRALTLAGNTPGRERWTAEEWLRLARAFQASGWDITPDQWSPRQLREALHKRRPLAPAWVQAPLPETRFQAAPGVPIPPGYFRDEWTAKTRA